MIRTSAPGPLAPACLELFLIAGDVCCRAESAVLTTVLGSCVAVWLWDWRHAIGGLNHFVLPSDTRHDEACHRPDPRYGDAAMDELIAAMCGLGGRLPDFEAKIFGGSAVLPSARGETVGDLNVRYAEARLREARIRIAARRTGGTVGRLIRCHTKTNSVMIRTFNQSEPWLRADGPPLALPGYQNSMSSNV